MHQGTTGCGAFGKSVMQVRPLLTSAGMTSTQAESKNQTFIITIIIAVRFLLFFITPSLSHFQKAITIDQINTFLGVKLFWP